MQRNLARWKGNYEKAKTDEIPEMDKLCEKLEANLPKDGEATIVHGDFR